MTYCWQSSASRWMMGLTEMGHLDPLTSPHGLLLLRVPHWLPQWGYTQCPFTAEGKWAATVAHPLKTLHISITNKYHRCSWCYPEGHKHLLHVIYQAGVSHGYTDSQAVRILSWEVTRYSNSQTDDKSGDSDMMMILVVVWLNKAHSVMADLAPFSPPAWERAAEHRTARTSGGPFVFAAQSRSQVHIINFD